jgi:hypothetical protein
VLRGRLLATLRGKPDHARSPPPRARARSALTHLIAARLGAPPQLQAARMSPASASSECAEHALLR